MFFYSNGLELGELIKAVGKAEQDLSSPWATYVEDTLDAEGEQE